MHLFAFPDVKIMPWITVFPQQLLLVVRLKENGLLRLVATRVFNVLLLHTVAFSKKLLWLTQTSVITLKTQTLAVNARYKRVSQLSLDVL